MPSIWRLLCVFCAAGIDPSLVITDNLSRWGPLEIIHESPEPGC